MFEYKMIFRISGDTVTINGQVLHLTQLSIMNTVWVN